SFQPGHGDSPKAFAAFCLPPTAYYLLLTALRRQTVKRQLRIAVAQKAGAVEGEVILFQLDMLRVLRDDEGGRQQQRPSRELAQRVVVLANLLVGWIEEDH